MRLVNLSFEAQINLQSFPASLCLKDCVMQPTVGLTVVACVLVFLTFLFIPYEQFTAIKVPKFLSYITYRMHLKEDIFSPFTK